MGKVQAQDIKDSGDEFFVSIRGQLKIHLAANHYPPVPIEMVPVCLSAIDACNDDDYLREIELPPGVLWRQQKVVPANAVIDSFHLDAWVACED